MIKIGLFIAGNKGIDLLEYLSEASFFENKQIEISFVSTFKKENDSFDESVKIIKDNKLTYFNFIRDKDKHKKALAEIDIALVCGFRYIIPKDWFRVPKLGIFVFHDSLLPKNRGWAPTFWALINGEETAGSTLFWISEEMDSGDIAFQDSFKIKENDDIVSLQEKVCISNRNSVQMLIDCINENKTIPKVSQNNDEATYCVWRSKDDCKINWENSAEQIHNLVRASQKPFFRAFFEDSNGLRYEVVRSYVHKHYYFSGCMPGRVFRNDNDGLFVIAGDGKVIVFTKISSNGNNLEKPNNVLQGIKLNLK